MRASAGRPLCAREHSCLRGLHGRAVQPDAARVPDTRFYGGDGGGSGVYEPLRNPHKITPSPPQTQLKSDFKTKTCKALKTEIVAKKQLNLFNWVAYCHRVLSVDLEAYFDEERWLGVELPP